MGHEEEEEEGMSKRPEWAQAKGCLHLAVVWLREADDGDLELQGVNWLHDKVLLPVSTFLHNVLVAPCLPDNQGFPINILEVYDKDFLDREQS